MGGDYSGLGREHYLDSCGYWFDIIEGGVSQWMHLFPTYVVVVTVYATRIVSCVVMLLIHKVKYWEGRDVSKYQFDLNYCLFFFCYAQRVECGPHSIPHSLLFFGQDCFDFVVVIFMDASLTGVV